MKQNINLNRVMESETISKNEASPKSLMSRGIIIQRTFLFFVVFCISIMSAYTQDIITLKNGTDIQALVQDIGEFDVKYKKFDNPNGPSYSLKKSEIFMIKYANGSKEVFPDYAISTAKTTPTLVTKRPSIQNKTEEVYTTNWGVVKYLSNKKKVANMEDLFYDMPEALKNYRSGKTWNGVGVAVWATGLTIMFCDIFHGLDNATDTHKFYTCPTYWTGFGIGIVGGIFSMIGVSKIQTATDLYNASVRRQQKSDLSLNFGITQSGGIGLTLNF